MLGAAYVLATPANPPVFMEPPVSGTGAGVCRGVVSSVLIAFKAEFPAAPGFTP
jgi:hypothetical protein